MTYPEALQFLYSQLPAYHRIGKAAYKNNLDNTILLDEHFRHPHRKFRSLHIAGTNGKGSVSHMAASILMEAGYKTGLYTSPHLKDFRERIKVNGIMIPEREVTDFVEENFDFIRRIQPSFFEMTVAMAFDYFSRQKVDLAVVEVGLGGRLDSTNIITPVASIITNIGHDHMDLLGNSLEKVATEKAGIIKERVPVIIGETQPETEKVFISKAGELHSDITFSDRLFECSMEEIDDFKGERKFRITDKRTGKVWISGITPLGGDYQQKNLVTVASLFSRLQSDFNCSDQNITDGIMKVKDNTGLMGRWQILGHDPLVVCDTGHNKEGLEYVVRQIKRIRKTVLRMVVGFVSDKDLSGVLPLLPKDAVYYFTKASVQRALDENVLKKEAAAYSLHGESYPDVKAAFEAARKSASESDMIFIGGSTFVVAEVV
ncbi:MAG TPA: folylpolyglutamate synthase/dihydrofolate synthase family protein [Bacteroidales bacterium]|nr:folylpolyglutamate synthase/dihydrofolate synthase family protein [Bacteroidales bacterium]